VLEPDLLQLHLQPGHGPFRVTPDVTQLALKIFDPTNPHSVICRVSPLSVIEVSAKPVVVVHHGLQLHLQLHLHRREWVCSRHRATTKAGRKRFGFTAIHWCSSHTQSSRDGETGLVK
jgi:hypothetical protein